MLKGVGVGFEVFGVVRASMGAGYIIKTQQTLSIENFITNKTPPIYKTNLNLINLTNYLT